jgi:hypothetical protein
VQFAAAGKAVASTQDFLKTYGQYQLWIPLGADDQILLRAEAGRTFAASREGIPEDFLFRAGGSRSVRGYVYESLGVQEGDAIVGGRYLATGSAEYIHWFRPQWGGAVFFDVGDAADSVKDWEPTAAMAPACDTRRPRGRSPSTSPTQSAIASSASRSPCRWPSDDERDARPRPSPPPSLGTLRLLALTVFVALVAIASRGSSRRRAARGSSSIA